MSRIIKFAAILAGIILLNLAIGCAQTSIQPLTKKTFEVSTTAAEICGIAGARRVATRVAAAEVYKRGYDKFIFINNYGGSRITGGTYNYYGGGFGSWNTSSVHNQALVVKIVNSADSLSAAEILRNELGENYKQILAKKSINSLGLSCGDVGK